MTSVKARTVKTFNITKKIEAGVVLYENIDQILPNKLHGPMHYKIGVAYVFNGHVFYTVV